MQRETPSQTAGPYVHIGCLPAVAGLGAVYGTQVGAAPVAEGARGARVTITGAVFDGTGAMVRDALIECWQADAAGVYPGQPGVDPAVSGFARVAVDPATGLWTLRTVKPGRVGRMAPHVALWIVARGINTGLQTRLYFADEDNAGDPVLAAIEHRDRVATLLAQAQGDGAYRFDIRLRGPGETVFLDM
jgi:protocatechuate 3,4-dioxygenase, alpha subunit